jgi:protein-disulfide isomerase
MPFQETFRISRRTIINYGLILAGLLLSVLSYLEWCSTEGCSRLHGAQLFSVNLSVWGIVFFLGLGLLTAVAKGPWMTALRRATLAGAVGSEVTFLGIQWALKEVCLLCIGVGAVVVVLAIMELIEMAVAARSGTSKTANSLTRGWVAGRTCLVLAGLAVGIVLTQPVKNEFVNADAGAAVAEVIPSVGKAGGYPIVRIYSDYFCPACRQQEPVVNAVVDEAKDKARILFCDLPTHGKISKLYIAYFIACLLGDNEDEELLLARQSLFDLAGEKVQANSQLESALRECGVNILLDGDSINQCFREIRANAAEDGVTSTPTVVVENKVGEKKVFKGKFSREELMEALES